MFSLVLPPSYPRCVFCDAPLVDGSVFLPDLDLTKLKNWWARCVLGEEIEEIDEETFLEEHCCMNCVREARYVHEASGGQEDCIWWQTSGDPYYEHYKRGHLRSCSVQLIKLPEEEEALYTSKLSGTTYSSTQNLENASDHSQFHSLAEIYVFPVKMEPENPPPETSHLHASSSCAGTVSPRKRRKHINQSPCSKISKQTTPVDDNVVCFFCQEKGPRKTYFQEHMCSKTCGSCDKKFSCVGLLRKHQTMCMNDAVPQEPDFRSASQSAKQTPSDVPNPSHTCFKCMFCPELFDAKPSFDQHMGKVHNKSSSSVFKCGECGKNLIGMLPLQRHMRETHAFESYTLFKLVHDATGGSASVFPAESVADECDICGVIITEQTLEKHVSEQHAVQRCEPLKCSNCDFTGASVAALEQHIKSNECKEPNRCKACDETFRTKMLYLYHVCADRPKVKCEDCSLDMYEDFLPSHRTVEGHTPECSHPPRCKTIQMVHELSIVFCKLCKTKLCSIEALDAHTSTLHGLKHVSVLQGQHYKELGHQCDKCLVYFSDESSRDAHKAVFHPNPNKHACRFCGKLTGCLASLREHFDAVHQLQASGQHCETCNLFFLTAAEYEQHQSSNKCSEPPCVKIFIDRRKIKRRMRINKQCYKRSDWEQTCQVCHISFFTPDSLFKHVMVVHDTVPAQKCNICDENFSFSLDMQRHLLFVHLLRPSFAYEVVPHVNYMKCIMCLKQVGRKRIKSHLETEHKDDLILSLNSKLVSVEGGPHKYECEYCEMGFSKAELMKEHFTAMHVENVATVCIYCLDYCSRWSNVTTHIKAKHTKEPIKCIPCESGVIPAEAVIHYAAHVDAAKLPNGSCPANSLIALPDPWSVKVEQIRPEESTLHADADSTTSGAVDGQDCVFCKVTVATTDMAQHITQVHFPQLADRQSKGTADLAKCFFCDTTCSNADMARHIVAVHFPKPLEESHEKKTNCVKKRSLKQPVPGLATASRLKKMSCTICNRLFCPDELEEHMLQVHEDPPFDSDYDPDIRVVKVECDSDDSSV